MKMLNFIIATIIITAGCKKPAVILPSDPLPAAVMVEDTTWVKKLWQVVFDSTTKQSMGTFAPVQYQDQILFGDKFNATFEPIKSANIFTGKLIWVNENHCRNHDIKDEVHILGNKLAYCRNWGELGVIDLNTGSTIWQYCYPANKSPWPGFNVYKNLVFSAYYTNNKTKGFIQCSRIDAPNFRDVFSLDLDSNFVPGLDEPSGYIAPNGDTLIIGCSRRYKINAPGISRADVYCQNITTGQLIWMHKDYDPTKGGSHLPPVIEGNIAYVLGGGNLTAINILTGAILYQKIYAAGRYSWLQVINGAFYMHISQGDEHYYQINPNDGSIIWQSAFTDYETSKPILYKNYLVSGGRKGVYFINKDNGELLYTLTTNNALSNSWYHDGIVIDPINKLLFCNDTRYMMCYKLKF
jgi:outer membrane protein assembly factor BamB